MASDVPNRKYEPVDIVHDIFAPQLGEDSNLNPIIFHHTLTGCKELWHEIPQIISDLTKRESFVFDARCHGQSDWSDDISAEMLVEDLRHFMDNLEIDKAILVGNSFGGQVISMYAAKYPKRVEMIINEDGALNEDTFRAIQIHALKYIKLWEQGVKAAPKNLSDPEAIKYTFNYVYERFPSNKGLEEKEKLWNFEYPIKQTDNGYDVNYNKEAVCKYFEDLIDGKHHLKIDGVFDGPGLFMMAGLADFHKGIADKEIKEKFPNVEVQILEGVTHNIHLRYPEKFIESFMTFYRKHYPLKTG